MYDDVHVLCSPFMQAVPSPVLQCPCGLVIPVMLLPLKKNAGNAPYLMYGRTDASLCSLSHPKKKLIPRFLLFILIPSALVPCPASTHGTATSFTPAAMVLLAPHPSPSPLIQAQCR